MCFETMDLGQPPKKSTRRKNAFFWSKFSKKSPKNVFKTIFQKFDCGVENLVKLESL